MLILILKNRTQFIDIILMVMFDNENKIRKEILCQLD